jgi:transposase
VELIVERAALLDVGKDEVVACLRAPDPAGAGRGRERRRQEVRTYPTFTSSLEALADWLHATRCSTTSAPVAAPAAAGARPAPGLRPAA